jgi:hypothetical protein
MRKVSIAGMLVGWALFMGAPAAAAEHWVWPVRGPVLTQYDNDNARPYAAGMHRGVDIGAKVGTAIVAAVGGHVTYAGALGSSGTTVALESSDGRWATSYLHLRSVAVRRGTSVRTGDELGEVGTTGRRSVSAPHLHFGVRALGREHSYVDPLTLLPAAGGEKAKLAPVPVGIRAPIAAPAPVPARAAPRAAVPGGAVDAGLVPGWGLWLSLAGLGLLAGLTLVKLRNGWVVERPGSAGTARGRRAAQPRAGSHPAEAASIASVSQVSRA